MAHAFQTYPASPTFGVFRSYHSANDYTTKLKNKVLLCHSKKCTTGVQLGSQGIYLAFLNKVNNRKELNTNNLNINLITKLDLLNVPVIKNNYNDPGIPTSINTQVVPYLNYTIDPEGKLFGKTTCGANDYLNYLVYTASSSTC
jgi:hypothetical protein